MVKTMPALYDSEQSLHSVAHSKNGTAACSICSALYEPSKAHAYLAQAPDIALESAFMSMCRFCFRCRRPACPLCWDDVHGLCGACVGEVHLPFRKEAEPLPLNSTLLVSSSPQLKQRHATAFPLVCIRPGGFHTDASQKEDTLPPELDSVTSPVLTKKQETHEAPVQDVAVPTDEQENKKPVTIARRVERILTVFLGIILLLIAMLIVIASFSEQANTMIAHVLHVDIRMEIEYLLQLIQQIL